MVRLNVPPKYYRAVVESEVGRQQTGRVRVCLVERKTPRNARRSGLKSKERDVIGRKGNVITVCVKMLDTDAVVGRKMPTKCLKPKTSSPFAEFSWVCGP